MVRLLLSFVIAGLAYELYWHLMSRWHGVHPRWFGRSRAEQRLREERAGYVRLVIAWGLVLAVYALGLNLDTASVSAFRNEVLDPSLWLFIVALAPFLAGVEWYFTARRIQSPAQGGMATPEISTMLPASLPEMRWAVDETLTY